MGLLKKMSENIKRGIRNWLQVQPANPYAIQIQEVLDFEVSAIRNRIWYRGDGNEIEQLYMQSQEYADKYKFWGSRCTPGMEMRKVHTGLPHLIIRVLCAIVLTDMNEIEFEDDGDEEIWEQIEKENQFRKLLDKSLKEALYIGDGAYKVTVDTENSPYPSVEWYPGDRIELIYKRGRLREVIFKTPYKEHGKQYVLYEYYGYGYVKNELYLGDKQVDINSVQALKGTEDITFDESVLMAVPLKIYESSKFEGRGGSVFDGKLDSFDSFDEIWSQWMEALRRARAKTYIPESYIPKDPNTGKFLKPNAFDNQFIAGDDNMAENGKNIIQTEQPTIPHDSYLASYCTALDLCLQGIISPSTLGIDVKKLDNAEAQREKEKTTLYTRDAIIEALQEVIPQVASACINVYQIMRKLPAKEVKASLEFGEYSNPSFESQIETVGKGRTQGIMSVEACVEELYGDTKEISWKKEEVARLKAEQGIAELEEPSVNTETEGFGAVRIGEGI